LVRERGGLFQSTPFAETFAVMTRMLPILDEVEANLSDRRFSPSHLASSAGINEVTLRKLFKTATGNSPVAFIQRRRVDKACELLRFTEEGIKEISAQCGFTELSFFYRVFKHWTGMTPSLFRTGV